MTLIARDVIWSNFISVIVDIPVNYLIGVIAIFFIFMFSIVKIEFLFMVEEEELKKLQNLFCAVLLIN